MAKLYFYYASMNAGKSAALLQADFNYRERGLATIVFTAAIDRRHRPGTVTSRIGLTRAAHCFDAATDLQAEVAAQHAATPLACVLVDEAQFLSQPARARRPKSAVTTAIWRYAGGTSWRACGPAPCRSRARRLRCRAASCPIPSCST